jgi:hypothetical protein
MIIKVSTEDIVEGNNSKDADPITIALRRKFGKNVSVGRDYIRYKKRSDKIVLVKLPKKAQDYLLDTLKAYVPFEFNLSAQSVKRLKG